MQLYPLKFTNILKERTWGSSRLVSNTTTPIGEIWDIVDRTEDNSIVAEGSLAGTCLEDLRKECKAQLVGLDISSDKRIPLIIKRIGTKSRLSLQVHPKVTTLLDDKTVWEAKNEFWHILQCNKKGEIIVGFKQSIALNKESLRSHLINNSVEDILNIHTVYSGDNIFIPAGLIHALGANITLLEIQENSDTTFRLSDWNRKISDRKLHIENGLSAIDFSVIPQFIQTNLKNNYKILQKDAFSIWYYKLVDINTLLHIDETSFAILSVLDGEINIANSNYGTKAKQGDSILLPANNTYTIKLLATNASYFLTYPKKTAK